MSIEQEITDLKERLTRVENSLIMMVADIATIKGSQQTTQLLCKWVITPLLLIVGTLVGVKLLAPGV